VYLGESRLEPERDVVWRTQTMARIGVSVLALEEPVSLALAELEAANDERLADADAPPPPPSSVALPSVPAASGPPAAPPPASAAPAEGKSAPIAEIGSRTAPTVVRKRKRVWTTADVIVVTIAVIVIGASIAGLVWVLR
jgi:hypothetical protein